MLRLCCLLAIMASLAFCLEPEYIVTKAYTDYLKKHVSWEVVSYEDNIFRGFTLEEAQMFLGNKPPVDSEPLPQQEPLPNLPESLDWRDINAACIHEVRNQGNCGSCWSFATSGMLADRCCLMSSDHGLLAYPSGLRCVARKSWYRVTRSRRGAMAAGLCTRYSM